jgi:hypothetical protein
MSGFSIDWLNLREDADERARSRALRQQALDWLGLAAPAAAVGMRAAPQPGEVIVTDLGSGTGATLRALSAPGSQHLVWRLVDHDGALLDEALRRHRRDYRIEDHQNDLAIVAELPLGGARLVTASALFDLVSAALVDRLVERLAGLRKGWPNGLYAALNYDGSTDWDPVHPYDTAVLAAFNRDQRRDKGLGHALGPDSGAYLQQALDAAGYRVQTAPSPWQLDGRDAALLRQLIEGMSAAVGEDAEIDPAQLRRWREFRLDCAATGRCRVGHLDVLGLPR